MQITISPADVTCITSRLTREQALTVWFDPDAGVLHITDENAVAHLDLSPAGVAAMIAAGPALPVPDTVTIAQARVALRRAGLFDLVDSAIRTAGGEAADAWEYGNFVSRNSHLVDAMSAALDLTDAQVDDLFRTAADVAF